MIIIIQRHQKVKYLEDNFLLLGEFFKRIFTWHFTLCSAVWRSGTLKNKEKKAKSSRDELMWFLVERHFIEALSLEVIQFYQKHKDRVNCSSWYIAIDVQIKHDNVMDM